MVRPVGSRKKCPRLQLEWWARHGKGVTRNASLQEAGTRRVYSEPELRDNLFMKRLNVLSLTLVLGCVPAGTTAQLATSTPIPQGGEPVVRFVMCGDQVVGPDGWQTIDNAYLCICVHPVKGVDLTKWGAHPVAALPKEKDTAIEL